MRSRERQPGDEADSYFYLSLSTSLTLSSPRILCVINLCVILKSKKINVEKGEEEPNEDARNKA